MNKELHHFHALSPRKTKNIYLDVGVPKFDSQYFSFVLIQQKKNWSQVMDSHFSYVILHNQEVLNTIRGFFFSYPLSNVSFIITLSSV